MSNNIKSLYLINKIFSYTNEKQKLKIIKYNKHLQKNINISIINYKHFQGKYITYREKGEGEEYLGYDNKQLYVGGFKNGERNGKGIEFYTLKVNI